MTDITPIAHEASASQARLTSSLNPRTRILQLLRLKGVNTTGPYNYTDKQGKLLRQVVRAKNTKAFRQRRPDGNGGWINNVDGVPDVPYRYPDIFREWNKGTEADVVFIVEGEKDVETLRALDLTATCNAGGAGNWPKGMNGYLPNDIVLIPDNDKPGHDHVEKVAQILFSHERRIRVLDLKNVWPECPPGGDISDWVQAGGTAERLRELVEKAPDYVPPKAKPEKPKTTAVEPVPAEDWEELDWEIEKPRVLDALNSLPNDDRDMWLRVGMAIHHATDGSLEGYGIWRTWSESSDKYDATRQHYEWSTFRDHANPVKLGSLYQLALDNGWQETAQLPAALDQPQGITINIPRSENDLASRTMAGVRKTFREERKQHRPSEEFYDGMEEIAKFVQGAASGQLEPSFHISSLPTGMGKTTTLIQAMALLPKDVGAIVFLNSEEQIENFAAELKKNHVPWEDYSVYMSADYRDTNKLGNQNKKAARIMITTQQALESRSANGTAPFDWIEDFYYHPSGAERGRVRQVRAWDEAIAPTKSVQLRADEIMSIVDLASSRKKWRLAKTLRKFVLTDLNNEIPGQTIDRSIVTVPDMGAIST